MFGYPYLLIFHSVFRWLVLASLVTGIYISFIGYFQHKTFSKGDNAIRHWTATIAHIQLMIGVILYIKSPITHYFWGDVNESIKDSDVSFFALYHFLLMVSAVVLITLGSALAKRKATDREKFKTMLIWFGIALLIIFFAIPWPFLPFAHRPYYRILSI